jgi:hypothetical protein
VCGNPASTDLCRVIEENSERKYDKVFLEVFYSIIYGDPAFLLSPPCKGQASS